jgi:hypothetical protein
VTRRVVRLFVLLGALVAAYLVLSLFDHAARADGVSIDQIGAADPVASVKATATDAGKAVREPKAVIPQSTTPKAHPPKSHRPTIKRPAAHHPRIQAPRKIQAPTIRAGGTVRRVHVRTTKLHQPTSSAVRDAANATATTARTAVVRQNLLTPAHLPSLPELAELPDLSQTRLPALPQLPGLSPAPLPAWPPLPSWSQLPGLPQARTPISTRTTALPSAPVPHQPLLAPVSVQVCPLPQPPALAPASGLSGVSKPPAAKTQPRTVPLPAPPRQPADRSTPTGQARDSGGGNTPAMGTVSSSWRPEVAAAGRCLATDLPARGRTVRYAGPPS